MADEDVFKVEEESGGRGDCGKRRWVIYLVIGIVVAVAVIALVLYLLFFKTNCEANPLFLQSQLDAMKRTYGQVGDYCSNYNDIMTCGDAVYYVYTTEGNVSSDARSWQYEDYRHDNIAGMRYWGTIENVCYWKG